MAHRDSSLCLPRSHRSVQFPIGPRHLPSPTGNSADFFLSRPKSDFGAAAARKLDLLGGGGVFFCRLRGVYIWMGTVAWSRMPTAGTSDIAISGLTPSTSPRPPRPRLDSNPTPDPRSPRTALKVGGISDPPFAQLPKNGPSVLAGRFDFSRVSALVDLGRMSDTIRPVALVPCDGHRVLDQRFGGNPCNHELRRQLKCPVGPARLERRGKPVRPGRAFFGTGCNPANAERIISRRIVLPALSVIVNAANQVRSFAALRMNFMVECTRLP